MKILVISERNDFRFSSLIRPLEYIGAEIGFTNQVMLEDIKVFSPDIIINNTKKIVPLNSVTIDASNLQDIEPFIDLVALNYSSYSEKLKSDICYIGNVRELEIDVINFIANCDLSVKVFDVQPNGFHFYAGMISGNETMNIYKSSKVCLLNDKYSLYRELDIIACNGKIARTVKDIEEGGYISPKKDTVKNNTNFDRLAQIFKKSGLSKIADKIVSQKGKL